nr:MAG TPA: hypothetical protein [Caudoviricetes sp.]
MEYDLHVRNGHSLQPGGQKCLRAVTLYKQIKGICPGVLIYSPS